MKKIVHFVVISCFVFLGMTNVSLAASDQKLKWTDPDYGFSFTHNGDYKNKLELERPCPSKNFDQCKKDDVAKMFVDLNTKINTECKGDQACIKDNSISIELLDSLIDSCEYTVKLCIEKSSVSDKNRDLLKAKTYFRYYGPDSISDGTYKKEPYFYFEYSIRDNSKKNLDNLFGPYVSGNKNDMAPIVIRDTSSYITPYVSYFIKNGSVIRKLDYSSYLDTLKEEYPDVTFANKRIILITLKPYLKNKNGVSFYKLTKSSQDNYNNIYCAVGAKHSVCFDLYTEKHPEAFSHDNEDSEVIKNEKYLLGDILTSFSFNKSAKKF